MLLLPSWAERWPVAHLATTDGDAPHVVAVVFCQVDEAIWIPIDGKPKSGAKLKRVRNIEATGHASLLVDQYDDDWSKLRWARADGNASVLATPTQVATAFLHKYPQYATTPLGNTAIRLVPRRVRQWSATPPPSHGTNRATSR